MIDVERARAEFARTFGATPDAVVLSPGRVNLIGEHVDYNDGLVLPAAIDRGTTLAVRRTQDGRVRARSVDMDGVLDVARDALLARAHAEPAWAPYVRGTLGLAPAPPASEGLELLMMGDLPLGAGLSSSASVEVGVAVASQALGWPSGTPVENARLGQRAEHEVVGVRCGIMDQLAVAAGAADHALLLDCRALTFELVPMPAHAHLLILDSGAPRTLAGSAYNERRASCEEATRLLGVSLRDLADGTDLPLDALPPLLRARARHVVTEIRRTRAMARALASADLHEAGRLMRASHESLRVDYEVSSVALDVLVEEVSREPAVRGARLTGAGFGGCVLALVDGPLPEGAAERALARASARSGILGRAFLVRASAGAHVAWARG